NRQVLSVPLACTTGRDAGSSRRGNARGERCSAGAELEKETQGSAEGGPYGAEAAAVLPGRGRAAALRPGGGKSSHFPAHAEPANPGAGRRTGRPAFPAKQAARGVDGRRRDAPGLRPAVG